MQFDLSDDDEAALIKELHDTTDNDRCPFWERICSLRGILAKLRPVPPRKALPSPKVYALPRLIRGRLRRG